MAERENSVGAEIIVFINGNGWPERKERERERTKWIDPEDTRRVDRREPGTVSTQPVGYGWQLPGSQHSGTGTCTVVSPTTTLVTATSIYIYIYINILIFIYLYIYIYIFIYLYIFI